MPDSDVDLILSVVDGILSDITKQPQLKPCVLPDGWIPIASLLNYTHLGQSVWPFGGVGVVADCLAARNSSVSELSGDNSCVRNKPLRVRLRHSLHLHGCLEVIQPLLCGMPTVRMRKQRYKYRSLRTTGKQIAESVCHAP